MPYIHPPWPNAHCPYCTLPMRWYKRLLCRLLGHKVCTHWATGHVFCERCHDCWGTTRLPP